MAYVTSFERIGEKRGELKKALEIAKGMLRENLPLEQIFRITGLSKDDLQPLLSQ